VIAFGYLQIPAVHGRSDNAVKIRDGALQELVKCRVKGHDIEGLVMDADEKSFREVKPGLWRQYGIHVSLSGNPGVEVISDYTVNVYGVDILFSLSGLQRKFHGKRTSLSVAP
jgi:hypothetical protein